MLQAVTESGQSDWTHTQEEICKVKGLKGLSMLVALSRPVMALTCAGLEQSC